MTMPLRPGYFTAAAAALLLWWAPLQAQQGSVEDATVARAVVATDVEEREPVGEATQFPATVGQLVFYTVLEGNFSETQFEHVWIREGEEVARVPLRAAGPRWRTWSAKTIPAEWTGDWSVKVVDSEGNELSTVDFTVGDG